MVWKHYGVPAHIQEATIPWHRWIRYVAVSLDLEEIEDYKRYCLSGGDPKKFKWSSPDHAGTRPPTHSTLMESLLSLGAKISGGKLAKKDIWEYGKATGAPTVFKANKWEQGPDGKYRKTGEVYVDKDGNEIDIEDYMYVPSQHTEALQAAREFFGAEKLQD